MPETYTYRRPAGRPTNLSSVPDVTGAGIWLNPDTLESEVAGASQRRAALSRLAGRITPEQIEATRELLTKHASLGPDLLMGLLVSGADLSNPAVAQLADMDAEEDDDGGGGGIWGAISGAAGAVAGSGIDALGHLNEQVLKPVVRGVTLVGESGYRELERIVVSGGALPGLIGTGGQVGPGEFRRRYREYGDSDLRNMIQGDTGDGGRFDLGTGYFPGGEVAQETKRENRLELNGRRANMGQLIAQSTVGEFYSPGDQVYDVIAGVSQFGSEVALDPTALVAAPLAAGRRASRALSLAGDVDDISSVRKVDEIALRAGLVNGARRKSIVAERTRDFLADDDMLQRIADADAFTVFRHFNDSRANRYSIDIAKQLGEASTVPAVRETLEGLIREGLVTERGFFPGQGKFIRKPLIASDKTPRPGLRIFGPDAKYSGIDPGGTIHAEDLDEAAAKLDSLYRQAGVSFEERGSLFNDLASVGKGDYDGLRQVFRSGLRTVAAKISDDTRLGARVIDDLTSRYLDEVDTLHTGAHQVFGWDAKSGRHLVPTYGTTRKVTDPVTGDVMDHFEQAPTLTSELGQMVLQMPDPADVRRAATKLTVARKVYTSKGWGTTVDFANKFTGTVFKTSVLLRPAFVAREFIEAQTSMAATGYDNAFTHPVRFLNQLYTLRQGRKGSAEITDLVGNEFFDVARRERAMTLSAGGWLKKEDLYSANRRVFDVIAFPDDLPQIPREYLTGWRKEMGRISAAPEGRKMAELGGDVEAWKDWARGPGRKEVERLFAATTRKGFDDEIVAAGMRTPLAEKAGGVDIGGQLPRRDVPGPTSPPDPFEVKLDSLATIVRQRVEEITGGFDPDLVDRIATQAVPFDEVIQQGRVFLRTDPKKETQGFHNLLKQKYGAGVKPPTLKVENLEYANHRRKMDDGVLDVLKEAIFNKPVNYFSRAPLFRQAMAKRSAELMDLAATDELRDEVFEATVKALNLNDRGSRHLIAELQGARGNAKGASGVIGSIEDYNDLVKAKAVDDVTSTLFDVANRGADQALLLSVVPFLDAYKETLTRWSRFAKDNPAFYLRGTAGVRELGDQGIFYADENSGEMMFRAPGGGLISKAMGAFAGGPAAGMTSTLFEARVGGLNVATDSLGPGFGPTVEMSAAFLKDPRYDAVKEVIAPFGIQIDNPKDLLSFDALGIVAPAWARKGLTAVNEGFDERMYASTFNQAVDAFAASGGYDLEDPEDVQRMTDDAEKYTRSILFARAMGQAIMPTGPYASVETKAPDPDRYHPDWDPENDPDGKWFTVGAMSADYYRLAEVYGYDLASQKFYEMYGREPFYFATGASTSGGRELPVTKQGDRWMRRNTDVVRDYPAVAGFFAPPEEDDAPLDFPAYERQLRNGDRTILEPEVQVRLAQSARARTLMHNLTVQTENLPTKQRERIRYMVRDQLNVKYPGWQDDPVDRVPAAVRLVELERAVTDRRLDDEPLTTPLRQYFQVRAQLLEDVRARVGSPTATFGRQEAARHRHALRLIGQNLQNNSPAFAGVWSALLLGELEED